VCVCGVCVCVGCVWLPAEALPYRKGSSLYYVQVDLIKDLFIGASFIESLTFASTNDWVHGGGDGRGGAAPALMRRGCSGTG
jgi:hypothetical protein